MQANSDPECPIQLVVRAPVSLIWIKALGSQVAYGYNRMSVGKLSPRLG
jgi:hypothetical protein